jgi:hypothetical protein
MTGTYGERELEQRHVLVVGARNGRAEQFADLKHGGLGPGTAQTLTAVPELNALQVVEPHDLEPLTVRVETQFYATRHQIDDQPCGQWILPRNLMWR